MDETKPVIVILVLEKNVNVAENSNYLIDYPAKLKSNLSLTYLLCLGSRVKYKGERGPGTSGRMQDPLLWQNS